MPIVNGDRWRTSSRLHWQPIVRRTDHYSPRVPPANRSPLETDPRNHLKAIHRPQCNDPRADYGFHVVVVVGGSENVLHPSSKLLTKLKSSINIRRLPKEKFDERHKHVNGYQILDSNGQSIDGAKYYRRVHKQTDVAQKPNLEHAFVKDAMQIAEEIIKTMNSRLRDKSRVKFSDESMDESRVESGVESNTFIIKKPVPIHCRFNPHIGGFDLSLSLVDSLGNPIHSQTDSFQYSNLQRYGQEATFDGWLPSSIKTLLDLHHKKSGIGIPTSQT